MRTPLLLALAACGGPRDGPAPGDDAWARIEPLAPGGPSGTARFRATPEGTRILVRLERLAPGAHGLHVATGDCRDPGPHFEPLGGTRHGGPMNPRRARHAGDLGNVVQDWHDETRYQRVDPVLALAGPDSIVGKPIVVTSRQDDLVTDPDGYAGEVIACGVVTALP